MSDTSLLIKSGAGTRLPALPVEIPPLEGVNLDASALLLRREYESVDQAVADYRSRHSAERAPFYRRYYLKEGRSRGKGKPRRYAVRYAWSLERPETDQTVGLIEGDDLAAAQVVIGNGLSRSFMTSIRWDLCEDREGLEPLALGRFDYWDLLKGVSQDDLARLARDHNLLPDIANWDFDKLHMDRRCQGCGMKVSINYWAFNIDSAMCANCGIRPFYSRIASEHLDMGLRRMIESDKALLDFIAYASLLTASMSEVHSCGLLPEGVSPQQALERITGMSSLLSLDDGGVDQTPGLVPSVAALVKAGGEDQFQVAVHGSRMLVDKIKSGGPFTEVEGAVANLLNALKANT